MGLSLTHLIVVLLLIFVIFGAGKLPRVMGDIGKGIRNLRDGMDADAAVPETPKQQIILPKKKPAAKKKTATVKTTTAKAPAVKSAPKNKKLATKK